MKNLILIFAALLTGCSTLGFGDFSGHCSRTPSGRPWYSYVDSPPLRSGLALANASYRQPLVPINAPLQTTTIWQLGSGAGRSWSLPLQLWSANVYFQLIQELSIARLIPSLPHCFGYPVIKQLFGYHCLKSTGNILASRQESYW